MYALQTYKEMIWFFSISASTGIIKPAARLDYEEPTDRHFFLNISATDHGSPQLSSYVTVHVNVTDYNDNRPVFNASSLVAEVLENLDPGTFVARVMATDLDSGNNSLVSRQRMFTRC